MSSINSQQVDIPPSRWTARCHHLEPQVSRNAHEYFLKHWPWRSEQMRERFPQQGLAASHCYAYPDSLDDRIEAGALFITILFLIDDELDHMSREDGAKVNDRIIGVIKREFPPNPNEPREWIMHEIWERMRAIDNKLAGEMEEPTFVCLRSQVEAERLQPKTLKSYFAYREMDVGSGMLLALQRWSMDQHLTPDELDRARGLETNFSNCIASINDLYSYRKEVLASRTLHPEGATIFSAVQVIADETHLPTSMAERVLWTLLREQEKHHDQMAEELIRRGKCSETFVAYVNGMKAQISGSEAWSRTTPRYVV